MTERLRALLTREIEERGPITFARYMEVALYDPHDGFFAVHPVGAAAHFVTSPHVSPVFATLLAAQLVAAWDALGNPSPFAVLEAGAGDGTLACAIVDALDDRARAAIRYVAVERSAAARARLTERGIDAAAAVREAAPEPFAGVVLANELLDNLPFHRLRARNGRTVEVMVGLQDGTLVEVEGAPTPDALAATGHEPADGEEVPSSPAARAFVGEVARSLARGYAFLIDYGFVDGERAGPVRGYRAQRLATDLLSDPGSTDITGPVDLAAVAAAAKENGLTAFGPVDQRDALMALGYRSALRAARERQAALEAEGRWREAVEVFAARGDASMLVDPAGLGSLRVLALATPGLPEPTATRGAR